MSKKKAKLGDMPTLFGTKPEVLYEQRFLEQHAGYAILHEPQTAIVELIANSWDAGATEVRIGWPNGKGIKEFHIQDNGTGLSDSEFNLRWRTLAYNRQNEQGDKVIFPKHNTIVGHNRKAYGRNGIGRWAGFCFGEEYIVETWKDNLRNQFKISKGADSPFAIEQNIKDEFYEKKDSGTRIYVKHPNKLLISDNAIKSEIGMRFLVDPSFDVYINNEKIVFNDIPTQNIEEKILTTNDGEKIILKIIDTISTDKTTKQHGIAWHVLGRLIGQCSWKDSGLEDFIDGRRIAAKRYTFIVIADFLAEKNAIKSDWTGFIENNQAYKDASSLVFANVKEYLNKVSESDRRNTLSNAKELNKNTLKKLGPLEKEKWIQFVDQAQQNCPSIKTTDVIKLSEILANLEVSKSGYALLHKISELKPDQLDDLHQILKDWTLDMVKIVLDEIGKRLKLIDELYFRINDKHTKEVQDLQPLFKQGLWIFGPEFETIEYTSNEGMTNVIQKLFKSKDKGASRNRPDFVVLPDGSSGFYSYPKYDDENGGEIGVANLIIIELKRQNVPIGTNEKLQPWRYVTELRNKGFIEQTTPVRCFVLGYEIVPGENEEICHGASVVTRPLIYNTVIIRAKNRLLKLYDRIKDAPIFENHKDELKSFVNFSDSDEEVNTQVLDLQPA